MLVEFCFGAAVSNLELQCLQIFASYLITSEQNGQLLVVLPFAIGGNKRTIKANGPIKIADNPHSH